MIKSTTIANTYKNKGTNLANIVKFLAIAFVGSIYLGLTAQAAIMLTPIPITLQTFGVITLALAAGSRIAAMSVVMYLFEGAIGLPVFAGGRFGLSILFGPTGGFLFGFIIYAILYGQIKHIINNGSFIKSILLGLMVELTLFSGGLLWLGLFVGYNFKLLVAGFFPFIIGSVIKSTVGVSGYKLFNNIMSSINAKKIKK